MKDLSNMDMTLDLFEGIRLDFDEIQVYKDLNLSVPKNRITTIVGPSGCGKSSLLNLLAGLISPSGGRILCQEETVGYIFQEDRLLPWATVYENVKLVRESEDRDEIMSILKALALEDFADKYPDQLSGGMRQRCAIARGFYYHSTLLLMDEPFKSLDYDLKLNLVKYLIDLWRSNANTILFVTHDIDEALLLGHRVIVMAKRPNGIAGVFNLETDLEHRDVGDAMHIETRSRIIHLLAGKETEG